MAPANTPAPIIAKLNGEVNKALNSKDIREQFLAQGVEPMQMTPEELGAFVKSELTKWTKPSRTRARRSNNGKLACTGGHDRPHLVGLRQPHAPRPGPGRSQSASAPLDTRRHRLRVGSASKFATRYTQATYALSEGQGERAVIGMAKRLAQRDAALLNGVLCHGLDYDDTHMTGIIHLTVSVLPTVLSLAGQRGASGADMLAAYIAGVETGARIASATRGGLHAHGFHPTAVVGAFASTLAAGRLLGLDAAQLVHAQGVALSMASGSLQFIEDGAWTKRMHPGWAAQAAITAATFAANGIQAPQAPYEGRYGFYRCISVRPSTRASTCHSPRPA